MRPVRHPIAMFVVAVLAVIGIGVGVVGGLTYPQIPARSYGRPPFAFSAAFPLALGGKLSIQCLGGELHCRGTPVIVEWSAASSGYFAWVFWMDRDTRPGARLAQLDTPQSYRLNAVNRRGVTYLVAAPTCNNTGSYSLLPGVCSDVVIVKRGKVTWVAGAWSERWSALPGAFVHSFRVAST